MTYRVLTFLRYMVVFFAQAFLAVICYRDSLHETGWHFYLDAMMFVMFVVCAAWTFDDLK